MEKIVERVVEVVKEVHVEKLVPVDRVVQVPVDRVVERVVEVVKEVPRPANLNLNLNPNPNPNLNLYLKLNPNLNAILNGNAIGKIMARPPIVLLLFALVTSLYCAVRSQCIVMSPYRAT